MTEARLRQEAAAWKADAERAANEMLALRMQLAEREKLGVEQANKILRYWEENEALRKRLESAIMFRIHTAPAYINNVDVMRCEGHRLPKQPYMWKVLSGSGAVLGKDGEWAHEPIPSSRDDEFYETYRFDTCEEAEAAALKALEVAG